MKITNFDAISRRWTNRARRSCQRILPEDLDRMIMLFGIDPTAAKIDAPEVFREARLFDRGQQSLVQLIILDSGDEVEQFTFANRSSPLDDLWRAFGRPPGEFKQRSHKGLHGIKLQNLLDQDSHSH